MNYTDIAPLESAGLSDEQIAGNSNTMNTEKLTAFVRDSKQMAESELRRTLIVEEDKRAELQQLQARIQQLQRVIAECNEALAESK